MNVLTLRDNMLQVTNELIHINKISTEETWDANLLEALTKFGLVEDLYGKLEYEPTLK
jgi:hypothetical protein